MPLIHPAHPTDARLIGEVHILPSRDASVRLGFYVEPTSALVWWALEETLQELSDPVVAILTGSGYKVHVLKR